MMREHVRRSLLILFVVFALAAGLATVACEQGVNNPTATESPAIAGDGGPLAVAAGGGLASDGDDSEDDSGDDDSSSGDSSSDDSSAAPVDCVVIAWKKCDARCEGLQGPHEVVGPVNGGAPCPESRPCGPPC